MSHDHMSMGGGSNVPVFTEFPKFYWATVGCAIGVATLVNVYNHVLCRQRLLAARSGAQTPAKPKSWATLGIATIFALTREASNFSLHIPLRSRVIRLPTAGRWVLVLSYAVTLIVLCLYGLQLTGKFTKEPIGYRCAVVTVAQLPLIFLLAGKNNIIGCLAGISYERLNWLHRWCARCMLLTATMHMSYFLGSWAQYDYIGYQLKNNKIAWKGLAAWCTLVWIVISSMTPIRGWNYEIFVVQHIISFALLITFVYIHVPADMSMFVWMAIAFFFFDRVVRAARSLYANISLFHPAEKKQGHRSGFWACEAEFTPLPHDTTRIIIKNPPISWSPGQHVFLSCHSVVPLQSHPFTVASLPEDGTMEFLIKAETGGTRKFYRHAEKTRAVSEAPTGRKTVAIEGPYGCLRPLRQFDSVVLLAGSTGATFTVPLLRDIIQGWRENTVADIGDKKASIFGRQPGAVTRHVRFVWIVKSRGQLGWFCEQLSSAYTEFNLLQGTLRDIKLELTVYITCDESFTEEHNSLLSTILGPNHDRPSTKETEHGAVYYRGPPEALLQEDKAEKKWIEETTRGNVEVVPGACGANGTCCCRTSVNENTPANDPAPCCCSSTKDNLPSQTTTRPLSNLSSSPPSVKQKLLVHPSITIHSGRPKTRDIIRRSLEQALGESAVVVCGPGGLVADVKQDVCVLSDERAVHKGTGAQGIYLHTESYSY